MYFKDLEIEDLVTKAQNGDKDALLKLCADFEGLMKKTALQPHIRPIYEEALAAAYLSFIEAVKLFDVRRGIHFAGYAESKVRFAVWNLFKRERRRWQAEVTIEAETGEDDTILDHIASSADVAAQVELKLLSEEMLRLLADLPAKQRQVILFTVIHGKSLTETAPLLGVTPQAICSMKKRALKELALKAKQWSAKA